MTSDTTNGNSGSAGERLAGEIRQLRNAAGLSQPQLAQLIGYTRQYVSLAESPTKNLPSRELVDALDAALNADGRLRELREHAKRDQRNLRYATASPYARQPAATPATSDQSTPVLPDEVERGHKQWRHVRQAPGVRGRELSELAAWLYPAEHRAPGGHVLTGPGWLLDEPVELDQVSLAWSGDQQTNPRPLPMDHVLPLTDQGERYVSYSRTVRDLVRPRLLQNRVSYRLLDVETDNRMTLSFGTTGFFDVFDVKQSVAHEFKAAWLASGGSLPSWSALPLRTAIGTPFDPQNLLMSPGISTLTIRLDRKDGHHTFVLHERDGGRVADGGGLCHVMPAGEFQPSSVAPVDVRNDFSLWRNIMREFSEEFLGNPEHDGNGSRSIDYTAQEPFSSFERARADGRLRMWHCGLVMEPLELGAGQLTVAVIDSETFDQLFKSRVSINDEGHLVGADDHADMPFTAEALSRLNPRLSASALTLLQLAWRDRRILLK